MRTYFASYEYAGYNAATQSVIFNVTVLATDLGSYADILVVTSPFTRASLLAMLRDKATEIANESLSAGITAADIVDLL